MSRTRALSVGLLTIGGLSVAVGVFLAFGLGIALIVVGVLLIAADFLVPSQ
jgi:hypothetical protein